MVIAPVALVVAVAHNLHKLTTDSEIIVMNGAGMRPWLLLQPFVAATIVASVLLATISAYVAPESLRMLRRWLTEVRTDLVSNIVQPGRFVAIEGGLAFNIRERRPNGLLVGILMDDRRDPAQRVTILAERGEILKNDRGNFLILESAASSATSSSSATPTSWCSTATPSTSRSFPEARRPSSTRCASAISGSSESRPHRPAIQGTAGPVPRRAALTACSRRSIRWPSS